MRLQQGSATECLTIASRISFWLMGKACVHGPLNGQLERGSTLITITNRKARTKGLEHVGEFWAGDAPSNRAARGPRLQCRPRFAPRRLAIFGFVIERR